MEGRAGASLPAASVDFRALFPARCRKASLDGWLLAPLALQLPAARELSSQYPTGEVLAALADYEAQVGFKDHLVQRIQLI